MPPKKLNQISGMPQIRVALGGWQLPITLKKLNQVMVNGFTQNTYTNINFKGVVQPLSPRKIMLKPEGERAWTWLQIHCYGSTMNLDVGDKIIYNDVRYKIMNNNDYTANGYEEYECILDFQGT